MSASEKSGSRRSCIGGDEVSCARRDVHFVNPDKCFRRALLLARTYLSCGRRPVRVL